MKIEDQNSPFFSSTVNKNVANFSRWLGNIDHSSKESDAQHFMHANKISNNYYPQEDSQRGARTGNNNSQSLLGGRNQSNDEFYWRHLEQLQESALNFKENVIGFLQEHSGNDVRKITLYLEKNEKYSPCVETKCHTDFCLKNKIQEYWCIPKFAIFFLQSGSALTHISSSFMPSYKTVEFGCNKIEYPEKEKRIQIFSQSNKFCLYRDEQGLELAINTEDLPYGEVKKLKIEIYRWIKQKGYVLKHFIINGVLQ